MEGKLKTRSSAHGVSDKVNKVFSGKIVSFLAFHFPLAYTAKHNHYFLTPTLVWRTPSLQFRAGGCINVLEAHTSLYPAETVFIMTSYGLSRSQWPRGLLLGSVTARLLWLRFRIPPVCGWLSLFSVVCTRVVFSATRRSLFQRSPTECYISGWS